MLDQELFYYIPNDEKEEIMLIFSTIFIFS